MDPSGEYPASEAEGGWSTASPESLGVDPRGLGEALKYHGSHPCTTSYGGALTVIYRGHLIAESYVTGSLGGPQPWTQRTCNDVKSSTKSIFGTAVGVFLDEHRSRVNLDSSLVGENRNESLIPQIWAQPLTDERKTRIKVRHVLSMTSGHESREPWLAPGRRVRTPGYSGSLQMYEYCFGWWSFEEVPSQRTLLFEPGSGFNYSNFGLEQMALAMRNLTGVTVGEYLYDRVLRHIGFPEGIRENAYRVMPYTDDRELNYSDEPGWGVGGGEGCNAYGADGSPSPIGGNSIAGSTFRCTCRDFTRLGHLWLSGGHWANRQLVPREWMKQATTRFRRADGASPVNYGHTFWIQDGWDNVPRDCFASRGHNANDCYVIPSLDLVVARQGNKNPSREERAQFVETLLEKVIASLP